MATEKHERDLVIIGAGPAGLFAAYYAGFRGMNLAIMDSLPEPGGQVSALYPEKQILDVAGFPTIKGQDLIDNCVAQAAPFDPLYLLGHRAEDLEHLNDHLLVRSHKGTEVTLNVAGIATVATDGAIADVQAVTSRMTVRAQLTGASPI